MNEELIADIQRLSKPFEVGQENYYLGVNLSLNKLWWEMEICTQRRDYCFSIDNIWRLIEKYGEEELKNYILNKED